MAFHGVGIYSVFLTNPSVSSIVFALYQMQFALVTPVIIFGAVAERVRLLPSVIFIFCWATIVYDVSAYWTWAARGWIRNLACLNLASDLSAVPCQIGGIDFAGGGPVHITAGFSGLAFALFVGPRFCFKGFLFFVVRLSRLGAVEKRLPHTLRRPCPI
jgi:Amt family ammonium transporter